MWVNIINKLHKILGGLGRPFYFLWSGETVSLLGAALMQFALGVWVYQKTGSVLDFSGVIVASMLPMLFVMPFAGSIADRFDRRYVMVAADITITLLTLVLAWLLWQQSLEINYLYLYNMLVGLAGAFRSPAYTASVSQLLPKEKYTQASGLMGMSTNLVTMFAPLVAGGLMASIGLRGIVLIDLITFCAGSLLILRAFFHFGKNTQLSETNTNTNTNTASQGSIAVAIAFFRKEPFMLGLFLYVILLKVLLSLVSTMLMPLVLSDYSEQQLGIILTFGSVGGLCGASVLVAFDGIPKHLMAKVLAADTVLGLCILLAGTSTSFPLYCACAFLALFAAVFSQGCGHSLWMRKVPLQSQGRIFSIIGTVEVATTIVVLVLGSVIVEKILDPALLDGGALATTVGTWIGTGKSRGLGLLFILCGLLGVAVSLSAFATPLRRLDLAVPDVK